MYGVQLLTDALLVVLRATGVLVGDGVKPDGADRKYAVLYSLTGGVADGPLDGREDDFQPMYQITAVGNTRQQADWVSDKLRAVMIPWQGVVGTRRVLYVRTDMSGGLQRDDDYQPPLFYIADRYRVVTTPS